VAEINLCHCYLCVTNFSSGGQISCAAESISREESSTPPKYFFCKKNATLTRPIVTGTSINGTMTAAKAAPELMMG